ncbi:MULTISPECIES: hypothetical protein [Cupriavidus]|uniref:hypothetical protein n=1 Tax=Cupriavidus TaxID=106589 RepID=UPI0012F5080C|nr:MULTISPECIES: hypothetical protein [Cupriavidus]
MLRMEDAGGMAGVQGRGWLAAKQQNFPNHACRADTTRQTPLILLDFSKIYKIERLLRRTILTSN